MRQREALKEDDSEAYTEWLNGTKRRPEPVATLDNWVPPVRRTFKQNTYYSIGQWDDSACELMEDAFPDDAVRKHMVPWLWCLESTGTGYRRPIDVKCNMHSMWNPAGDDPVHMRWIAKGRYDPGLLAVTFLDFFDSRDDGQIRAVAQALFPEKPIHCIFYWPMAGDIHR